MEIKKGSRRIVLIFKKIAIKLPRTYPLTFKGYQEIKNIRKKNPSWNMSPPKFKEHLKSFFGIFGIQDNWSEYLFSKKNNSNYIAKTYFSLFGFLNIIEKAEIVIIDKNNPKRFKYPGFQYQLEIKDRIEKIIECTIWNSLSKLGLKNYDRFIHNFGKPRNYGIINNLLVMVDYAGNEIQKFIVKYGDDIHQKFKFE